MITTKVWLEVDISGDWYIYFSETPPEYDEDDGYQMTADTVRMHYVPHSWVAGLLGIPLSEVVEIEGPKLYRADLQISMFQIAGVECTADVGEPIVRTCAWCGETYTDYRGDAADDEGIFCSDVCRLSYELTLTDQEDD